MANTVSLEVARRLKAAGHAWKPQILTGLSEGKYCYMPNETEAYLIGHRDYCLSWIEIDLVYAPTLTELLLLLEEMGYCWNIGNLGGFGEHEDDVCVGLFDKETKEYKKGQFYAQTPEDAAGLALIWALGQEKKGENEK